MANLETPSKTFRPFPTMMRLLEFATASHARALAFLTIISLFALTPGFFQIPPIDRAEARTVQGTKQMIETGDFREVRFQDDVRNRPPGIYWLQAGIVIAADALGVRDARTRIFLYRAPSLIGAIGAVLVTYWAALAFLTRRYAYLAALMLSASILIGIEARIAKPEALALLASAAMLGALARLYLGRFSEREMRIAAAIFWISLALGLWVKGLAIAFVAAAAIGTLVLIDRSGEWLKRLNPVVGLCVVSAVTLLWLVPIVWRARDAGFLFAFDGFFAPPLLHSLLLFATFWPATPLLLIAAPDIWRARTEANTKFLLAAAIPALIGFELTPFKQPHDVLPLFPAFAILTAQAMEQKRLSNNKWVTGATLYWPVLPIVITLASIVAVLVIRRQLGLAAWPLLGAAMIFGFLSWRLYETDGPEHSILRAATTSGLLAIAVYAAIIPSLRPAFPSARVMDLLRLSECGAPALVSAGFGEPSLVFLAGTDTRLTDGAGAAEFLAQGFCRYAIVDSRAERAFGQRADRIGLRYALEGQVEGFNLNTGRAVTLNLFRSESAR